MCPTTGKFLKDFRLIFSLKIMSRDTGHLTFSDEFEGAFGVVVSCGLLFVQSCASLCVTSVLPHRACQERKVQERLFLGWSRQGRLDLPRTHYTPNNHEQTQ